MAYDFPYRLEMAGFHNGKPIYEIVTTQDGVICKGLKVDQMRELIEAANERKANGDDRHR